MGKECVGGAREPESGGLRLVKSPRVRRLGSNLGLEPKLASPRPQIQCCILLPPKCLVTPGWIAPKLSNLKKGVSYHSYPLVLLLEVKVSLPLHHKTFNILLLLDPKPEHLGVAGHLIYDGLAQQSGLDWVLQPGDESAGDV